MASDVHLYAGAAFNDAETHKADLACWRWSRDWEYGIGIRGRKWVEGGGEKARVDLGGNSCSIGQDIQVENAMPNSGTMEVK